MKNLEKFLEGLTRLTRETGIRVEGCGCCGSPFLEKVNNITAAEREYQYDDSNTAHLGPESALRFVRKEAPVVKSVNTEDLKSSS